MIRPSPPIILPVMVGTAGHVDHGKTALVKNLTGCDTDRLPEEKARGLTIDLGFAPCRLPGNRLVGIVDVPGHEDFIRNMVAGATSIDVLMLVIAADDGVMPQTREHLLIVKLLRHPLVMVAMTKIDLVDPATREEVRAEIATFLSELGFSQIPILPVSNVTGEGLDAVRQTLTQLVEKVRRIPDRRAFRMPVERVFTVKGYGTVATGIPISGMVRVGDEVELLPAGTRHRVRALQCYKYDKEMAVSGACTALNLRDLDANAIGRGMALTSPGIYSATSWILASVKHVHPTLVLKRTASVKFHAGTGYATATIKRLDGEAFRPQDEGLFVIRLVEPMPLAAGDPFILRSLSPVTTVAGGVVLSMEESTIRRTTPGVLERLRAARMAAEAGDGFRAALLAGPSPIRSRKDLLRLTQSTGEEAEKHLQEAAECGVLVALGGDTFLIPERTSELVAHIEKRLRQYHTEHPDLWGMEPSFLCEELDIPLEAFDRLATILAREGDMEMRYGRLGCRSFLPSRSKAEIMLREEILKAVEEGGIHAPALGDLEKRLGRSADLRRVVRLLVEESAVIPTGTHLFAPSIYATCRNTVIALLEKEGQVDLKAFRNATGSSRNLAVELLERFDAEGLTRRVGNLRVAAKRA